MTGVANPKPANTSRMARLESYSGVGDGGGVDADVSAVGDAIGAGVGDGGNGGDAVGAGEAAGGAAVGEGADASGDGAAMGGALSETPPQAVAAASVRMIAMIAKRGMSLASWGFWMRV